MVASILQLGLWLHWVPGGVAADARLPYAIFFLAIEPGALCTNLSWRDMQIDRCRRLLKINILYFRHRLRISSREESWPVFLRLLRFYELGRFFNFAGSLIRFKPKPDILVLSPNPRVKTYGAEDAWLLAYCNWGSGCIGCLAEWQQMHDYHMPFFFLP